MTYSKLLPVLLACLLMILALVGCGEEEPTATPTPTPTPAAIELLESGRFTMQQGNQSLGTEDFELWQTETGLRLISTFGAEIMGSSVGLHARLDVDNELAPSEYELVAQTPTGEQRVEAQFTETSADVHIAVGNETYDFALTGEPPLVVLDNNLVGQFTVIHRLVQRAPSTEEVTMTAVVPQAISTYPTKVHPRKPAVAKTGNTTLTLVEYPFRLGDLQIAYYTYGDTVVAVNYPTQQILVYRADLYPDGLQILTTEEPEPPPEGVQEVDITFTSDGLKLAGTLALPEETQGSVPAVVFVHGSGPVDRNENVPGLEIDVFRAIAHRLAQAGIGSLRYDKRGVGESEGIFSEASMTDLLNDARAAIDFLKAREEIDGGQLFVIGHSEGGILGPILASEGLVSGVVTIAGPAHPLDWILIEQTRLIWEASGLPPDLLEEQIDQTQGFIDFVKQSQGEWADIEYEDVKEYIPELTEQGFESYRMGMALSWWREHFLHDPLETTKSVQVPVLIIQGEKDLQVPYTEAELLAEALDEAGNDDVALYILPDMNHLVRYHPEEPNMEYRHVDEPVDERVLAIVETWVLDHVQE